MKEDIQFLKELQQELLTQETDYQAAPRFWVIMDYRNAPANEDYDNGYEVYIYNDGDYEEFHDFKDLKQFLEMYFKDEIELDIELQNRLNDEHEDIGYLWDYIEETLNYEGHFSKVYMKEESYIVPDTMFITKEDAKKHLESNKHHYSPKAHTYAMTAWRSPSVNRLWKILETFEWDKIEVKE